MGTVIKAKRDGFRRAGLVHSVAGAFYADGDLSEDQLKVLRDDPHLVVVEGVQEDALQLAPQQGAGLVGEMGDTIAHLEHQLVLANQYYDAASAVMAEVLEQMLAAPGLIVAKAAALEPADPAAEGVICITGDVLLSLISEHLQPVQAKPEAPDDANNSTLDNPSSAETAPGTSTAAPVSPPPGADSGAVTTDKPTSDKATKKPRVTKESHK